MLLKPKRMRTNNVVFFAAADAAASWTATYGLQDLCFPLGGALGGALGGTPRGAACHLPSGTTGQGPATSELSELAITTHLSLAWQQTQLQGSTRLYRSRHHTHLLIKSRERSASLHRSLSNSNLQVSSETNS